jgi:hypothetical protein
VAVPEHQQVGVGEARGAAGLAALLVPRLVDHGQPDALDLRAGDLGQPLAQRPVVVVAVDGDQPAGTLLEAVQQRDVHPVTGVHDDVRGVDRGPQRTRQVTRTPGDVRVCGEHHGNRHVDMVANGHLPAAWVRWHLPRGGSRAPTGCPEG